MNGSGDTVDLYGYTSLVVATVQAQAKRIEALEREVAELRARLEPPAGGGTSPRSPARRR